MKPTINYMPLDPAIIADPYPVYAAMRAHSPVHWNEHMRSWVLTRYRDCRDVLRDHELFARDQRRIGRQLPDDQLHIQAQDPPEQAELRRLIIGSMWAQSLDQICVRARRCLESQMEGRTAGAGFDLMSEIAAPIALQISCELVGVHDLALATYHRIFKGLTRRMDARLDPGRKEEGEQAANSLSELMRSWFEAKPDTGMIGHLQNSLARNPMPAPYVQNTMCAVFNASYSTLYASTGSVILTLMQRQEKLAALGEPDLLETGVDELIRFVSPAQGTSRYATRSTRIGDTHINASDTIVTLLAAANRDPQQFADPDELILDRAPNPHLGFGWGPHTCAGTRIAMLWIRELARFLHEHPNCLELAGDPSYMHTATLRNLSYLPVAVRADMVDSSRSARKLNSVYQPAS